MGIFKLNSFLVLYSNSIGVKLEEETLVPRVLCCVSRRLVSRSTRDSPGDPLLSVPGTVALVLLYVRYLRAL
jgi:hypothetical protein